jgi:hypothetical protein
MAEVERWVGGFFSAIQPLPRRMVRVTGLQAYCKSSSWYGASRSDVSDSLRMPESARTPLGLLGWSALPIRGGLTIRTHALMVALA